MQKITIVEDDPAMREELVLLLENEGYQVQAVTEFTEVVAQVRSFGANLVLLDLGLPGRDGFSLCADLRKTCGVPIILVTSRNSTMDELRALSLGGDDYITKPYNIPILLATGTSPGVLILLLAALFLVFLAAQAQAFRRMRRTIETWERLLEGLDQKYLFPECAPKPQRLYERKLLDITRRSGQAMIGAVSEAQAAQRDYREYVERWVHEIKTPITAARLMARRSGADTRRKLEAELDQIGAHVERTLFYARAENPEKDVLIHPANLSDLVNQAVQAHRALLLQNGVSVELCDLDFVVYTDRKWVCFLLGQLLQNAARYRRARPVIALSARRQEKRVELTVSDNGMGIPAHELPRVFDRGFTGSNGRLRGGSTGMGLYLAKKLADALEISLAIRSEEGVGTQVLLTFPAQEKLTKL